MLLSTHGIISPNTSSTPFSSTISTIFDGVDDYVDMGNASTLNFDRTDPFTFSFWVKRNSFNANHVVIGKANSSGNRRGYFINLNSANRVVIQLRNNITSNSFRLNVQSTTLINTSNWYHIAITYDGTSTVNSFEIYINGNSDIVTNKVGTLSATIQNPAPFYLGRLATLYADVTLDEVSVFNSVLSASDISSIYNSGTPNDISALSPIHWWRMGENDTYPTINDNAGSVNGTMQNMSSASFVTDVP